MLNDTFPLHRYLGCSDHSGVFLAEFPGQEPSQVAVKLVPAGKALAESQLMRWDAAAGLTHPHLIRILETGRCQLGDLACLYVVTEYADLSLADLLPQRSLSEVEAREMLLPTLSALTFLHNRNLVHGQLKPANILAVGDQLKLAGDTIRRVSEAMTWVNIVSAYDPPEAREGNCSTASDVWALGVTLYEALTRTLPPGLDDRRGGVVLPPDFSPTFREMITWCLSRRPYDRPKLAEIEAWVRRQSGEADPEDALQSGATALPTVSKVESRPAGADAAEGVTRATDAPQVITAEPTPAELGLPAGAAHRTSAPDQGLSPPAAVQPAAPHAAAKIPATATPSSKLAVTPPAAAETAAVNAGAPQMAESQTAPIRPAPSQRAAAQTAARNPAAAGANAAAVRRAAAQAAQTAAVKPAPAQVAGAPASAVKPTAAQPAAAVRPGPAQVAGVPASAVKPAVAQPTTGQKAAATAVAGTPTTPAVKPAAIQITATHAAASGPQVSPVQAAAIKAASAQTAPVQTAAVKPEVARTAANEAVAAKLAAAAQMAASQASAAKSAAAKIAAIEAAAREIATSRASMLASSVESEPQEVVSEVPDEGTFEQDSPQRRPFFLLALGAVAILALIWASVVVFMTHPSKIAPALPAQASEDAVLPTPPEPAPAPVPVSVPVSEPSAVQASDTPNTQQAPVEAVEPPSRSQSGIHVEIPTVPERVLKAIRGHVRVSVRVIVVREGTVFAALVDAPGPSKYFERLALDAAKKWTFPPVDNDEQRWELVSFDFTRDGTTGGAVPIQ